MNNDESEKNDADAIEAGSRRPRMAITKNLPSPNDYANQLTGLWSEYAIDEERAPQLKGEWRKSAFKVPETHPLDLEIGTGNGYHFSHLAKVHPDRSVLGIEIKYKPLIQSIRRAVSGGAKNARIARYDAGHIQNLFAPGELDNVYIHHPDPWPKKRQWKHRLIQTEFLVLLYELMRPGTFVDFKTDSADYFEWSIELFNKSPFKVTRETRNLHQSDWKDENFVTHFEKIFLAQGLPIHYARLEKI
ncbi:MAG: tRNA (guanosine(46)-N7)-methyltransferase TrmB [Bdellovibrionota bacterium]